MGTYKPKLYTNRCWRCQRLTCLAMALTILVQILECFFACQKRENRVIEKRVAIASQSLYYYFLFVFSGFSPDKVYNVFYGRYKT